MEARGLHGRAAGLLWQLKLFCLQLDLVPRARAVGCAVKLPAPPATSWVPLTMLLLWLLFTTKRFRSQPGGIFGNPPTLLKQHMKVTFLIRRLRWEQSQVAVATSGRCDSNPGGYESYLCLLLITLSRKTLLIHCLHQNKNCNYNLISNHPLSHHSRLCPC